MQSMANDPRLTGGVSRLRVLMLVNWREDGKWHLLRSLKRRVRSVAVQQPVFLRRAISDRLYAASCYLSEFYGPVMALFKKNRCDVVISWQMRLGVCYGLLKRFFHAGGPPFHIIQDLHIDLTQTHWLYRLQIGLLKLAAPGIDYFFTTSTEEEAIYSRMLRIPRHRIRFLPLAESPASFAAPVQPGTDYIFAYGKSDRDFDTLIQAVAPLGIRTRILSRGYHPGLPLPDHIDVIQNYISEAEMKRRIALSRMVVLPIKDYRVSAGQISMLEVMALGKPLVVAENMATREYAVHGETAVFYPPGDVGALRARIRYLWEHPEMADAIGRRARESAMALEGRRMDIIDDVLAECALRLPEHFHRSRI